MAHLDSCEQFRSARVAIICAFAFVAASNHCNVEALLPHAGHTEPGDHHEAAADHHHDINERSAPHHNEAAAARCATIQAIVAALLQTRLHTVWLAHALPIESRWTGSLIESLHHMMMTHLRIGLIAGVCAAILTGWSFVHRVQQPQGMYGFLLLLLNITTYLVL